MEMGKKKGVNLHKGARGDQRENPCKFLFKFRKANTKTPKGTPKKEATEKGKGRIKFGQK